MLSPSRWGQPPPDTLLAFQRHSTHYARCVCHSPGSSTHMADTITFAEVSLAECQTRRSPDLWVTVVQRKHPHTVGFKVYDYKQLERWWNMTLNQPPTSPSDLCPAPPVARQPRKGDRTLHFSSSSGFPSLSSYPLRQRLSNWCVEKIYFTKCILPLRKK